MTTILYELTLTRLSNHSPVTRDHLKTLPMMICHLQGNKSTPIITNKTSITLVSHSSQEELESLTSVSSKMFPGSPPLPARALSAFLGESAPPHDPMTSSLEGFYQWVLRNTLATMWLLWTSVNHEQWHCRPQFPADGQTPRLSITKGSGWVLIFPIPSTPSAPRFLYLRIRNLGRYWLSPLVWMRMKKSKSTLLYSFNRTHS